MVTGSAPFIMTKNAFIILSIIINFSTKHMVDPCQVRSITSKCDSITVIGSAQIYSRNAR